MYGVTILEVDKEFRLTVDWTAAGPLDRRGAGELSEGAYREIAARGAVQTVPFRSGPHSTERGDG